MPPVIQRHDSAADWVALGKLAEQCERFSPLVGWETLGGNTTTYGKTGKQIRNASSRTAVSGTVRQKIVGERTAGESQWEYGGTAGLARATRPDLSPFHLLLDITGIGRLFGGEERLLEELRFALRKEGYVVQGAVAGTIGAAWACVDESWPEGTAERVAEQSVARLRLPAATIELLRQLGMERIGQLSPLPRAALAARFGPGLLRRLDQLWGHDEERIRPYRAPPEFQVERCLEEPLIERAGVERVVEELLAGLSEQLRPHGIGALELRGRLDCSRAHEVSFELDQGGELDQGRSEEAKKHDADARHSVVQLRLGLFRPSACVRHWSDLVRMQWERLELPGAVGRVGFQVSVTAPLEERQADLFARGTEGDERCVGGLLERLGSRLGAEAVWRPQVVAAALPERAFRREPTLGKIDLSPTNLSATPKRARARRLPRRDAEGERPLQGPASPERKDRGEIGGSKPAQAGDVSRNDLFAADSSWRVAQRAGVVGEHEPLQAAGYRPSELLHPPVSLEVTAIAPEGPPQTFCWERRWHRVVCFSGPERIETGWWRGTSVRRDYYRVETETGARFWLYRDLPTARWFLHGLFT